MVDSQPFKFLTVDRMALNHSDKSSGKQMVQPYQAQIFPEFECPDFGC
jgi:hypothetical protein